MRKKQGRLSPAELQDPEIGDQYTFIALDPVSKLVVAHAVGKRDADTAMRFVGIIRRRLGVRLQIFTDGFCEYVTAIDRHYELAEVDYAQVIHPRPNGLKILHVSGFPDETLDRDVLRRAAQRGRCASRSGGSRGRRSGTRRSCVTCARPSRSTSPGTTSVGSTRRCGCRLRWRWGSPTRSGRWSGSCRRIEGRTAQRRRLHPAAPSVNRFRRPRCCFPATEGDWEAVMPLDHKGSTPELPAFLTPPAPAFTAEEIAHAKMRSYGFRLPDPWRQIADLQRANAALLRAVQTAGTH